MNPGEMVRMPWGRVGQLVEVKDDTAYVSRNSRSLDLDTCSVWELREPERFQENEFRRPYLRQFYRWWHRDILCQVVLPGNGYRWNAYVFLIETKHEFPGLSFEPIVYRDMFGNARLEITHGMDDAPFHGGITYSQADFVQANHLGQIVRSVKIGCDYAHHCDTMHVPGRDLGCDEYWPLTLESVAQEIEAVVDWLYDNGLVVHDWSKKEVVPNE